jgi:Ca2+-binding EF-hand superfamily protein
MFRSGVLCAVLSTVLIPALALAQALPKPAPKQPVMAGSSTTAPTAPKQGRFDEIDTNHDGFLSRDEFLAAEKKRFDEFDTNHDGKTDAKEIASSPPLMERNLRTAERMTKQWDANSDGVVTAEEFRKSAEDRFAKQDKEGTGKIARKMPPPGMQQLQKPGQTKAPLPAPPADPKKN